MIRKGSASGRKIGSFMGQNLFILFKNEDMNFKKKSDYSPNWDSRETSWVITASRTRAARRAGYGCGNRDMAMER